LVSKHMNISFFSEEASSASAGRLPFIEDYVEQHKPPYAPSLILSVSRTRKKTGYMVNTEHYSIFLFEGSAILRHILEALNLWIDSHEGMLLVAQPSEIEPFYQLGTVEGSTAHWVLTKGKYSWQPSIGSDLEKPPTSNPFLLPTQKSTRTKTRSATAQPISPSSES
jgi:hypothetical protein